MTAARLCIVRQSTTEEETMTEQKIEPGIYFGMPEEIYHAAPWVGSSMMKLLYSSPPDFWHESPMNPLHEPETPSFAFQFGSALHSRVLYGEERFKRDFEFVEEDGDTVSAEGLKKWITEAGGKPHKLKADNEKMVREDMGRKLLTRAVYDKVMISAQMITKNPHLAAAFVGGWPEVSIFWEQDGVPCKARLDYLRMRTIVDLKSFRSKDRIRTIDEWIMQDLFNYRYDVQVAHYQNGHRAARQFVEDGRVFGVGAAPQPDNDWLRKAFDKEVGWTFIFYKADGMPISKSYQIAWGSPAHESGKAAVRTALANYADNLAKFGTDAWVNTDEPYPIDDHDLPKWL